MADAGGGREGEAILLDALRQSGCPIPPEVQTYGDVATRPELLVSGLIISLRYLERELSHSTLYHESSVFHEERAYYYQFPFVANFNPPYKCLATGY
jgi:hypothetical protein